MKAEQEFSRGKGRGAFLAKGQLVQTPWGQKGAWPLWGTWRFRCGLRLDSKGAVGGQNHLNHGKDLGLYPGSHEMPLKVLGKG